MHYTLPVLTMALTVPEGQFWSAGRQLLGACWKLCRHVDNCISMAVQGRDLLGAFGCYTLMLDLHHLLGVCVVAVLIELEP
jgi:hypothetical protein